MAARKKAARSGAKASRKGKTSPKTARKSAKRAEAAGPATRKAVSKASGRLARPAVTAAVPARKAVRKKAASRPGTSSGSQGFPEISDLAELMEQHGLVEVEYERSTDGSTRIHVKRAGAAQPAAVGVPMAAPTAAPAGPAPAAATPAAVEPAAPVADDLHAFKSPMVGTFYRAPSPEASPFASVGDTIEVANTVCIIEAMKVMNEITPDISGEVVSIEVENGEAVEYGQTLMLIRTR